MTGFVYAIQNDAGHVKIGWSSAPEKRLSKINSDTSSRCRLLGYVAATREQEAALHTMLAPARVHAEWFSANDNSVALFLELLPKPPVQLIVRKMRPGNAIREWRREHGRSLDYIGKLLGITRAHVSRLETGNGQFAPKHVFKLEQITGISRHVIRPDIYGPAPQPAEAAA